MIKKSIDERYIWLNGELVEANKAQVGVLSATSQFGLNVFEGIRCYWNDEKEQLYAFRLKDHIQRLKRSARLIQIKSDFTDDEYEAAFRSPIIANNYKEDIAVRQTLFVEGGTWSSISPVGMFVAPIPKRQTNPEYNKCGLSCCVSSWRRISDNTISPRIKCGANYINSRAGQLEALRNGYDTCVFLNEKNTISEGPGSCLFGVINGHLVTPLLTDCVLESITRDTIIKIANEEKILPVEIRAVDRTELYQADELFLCGSAMEITPILSIDNYVVGEGREGHYTTTIRNAYINIVRGYNSNYYSWLTPIY